METVGLWGARLILLEDEVSEFLERVRYERIGEWSRTATATSRARCAPPAARTKLERPRVRDASKLGFGSRVLGKHVTRTYALESLVISSFLRGLSTRDVEAVLVDTFEEPISSR